MKLSSLALATVLVSAALAGPATAQTLPGAATPGGVQPQLDEQERLSRQRDSSRSGDLFNVPPVLDRPPPMAGPRVRVEKFDLFMTRAPRTDERTALVSSLEAMLEERRQAQPAAGFTISELEAIAGEVTTKLRSAGYIVSRAYLPQQAVSEGTVAIRVLDGVLGKVTADGNQSYSEETLARPFEHLIGKPVRSDSLESALLSVTDYPGLTPFGVLGAGSNVGETDLTLRVIDEDPLSFAVSVDNYGSEFTGQAQLIGEMRWNNPTGAADAFLARILQTSDPSNSTFGSVSYRRPFLSNGLSIGAGYLVNDYDLGRDLAGTGGGDTNVANVFLRHQIRRSRTSNIYALADLSVKEATIDSLGAMDELTVISGEVGFDFIDRMRGINQGSIAWSHGFDDVLGSMDNNSPTASRFGGTGEFASGLFNKVEVSFSRLQRVNQNNHVLLRMFVQHSDDLLTSLEQLSLGGPYNVRAYPVSTELVDKGGYATLEWISNAPGFADKPAFGGRTWGQVLSLSLFYDYAGGQLNDPLSNENRSTDLSGYGLGIEMNVSGKLRFRLDAAKARSDNPVDEDPQYYAFFRYSF